MKIQPILELKGIRIELTLEEAEKIARSPVSGADHILKDVKMLVELHHSQDNAGDIIPAANPHIRLDGSKPTKDKQLKRPKPERIECEFCKRNYKKGLGISTHLRHCKAAAKAEEQTVKERGVLENFVRDQT